MAKKRKAKKAPAATSHPKKGKKAAHKKPGATLESLSLPERRKAAARRRAASMKTLLAPEPSHRREPPVASTPRHQKPRGAKKHGKRHVINLRFTENTLRDIAALECVRRCFH